MGNQNSHTSSSSSNHSIQGNDDTRTATTDNNNVVSTTTTSKKSNTTTSNTLTTINSNGTTTPTTPTTPTPHTNPNNAQEGTRVHIRRDNNKNNNVVDVDDNDDDCQFPCFLFFNLHHHKKKKNPILGSPLPDTPMMERRRRQEITQTANTVLQREQQQQQQRHQYTTTNTSSSSSNIPSQQQPQPQPQQHRGGGGIYTGLETEESLSSRSFRLPNLIPPPMMNPNHHHHTSSSSYNNNNNTNNNNNNGASSNITMTNMDYITTPPNHDHGITSHLLSVLQRPTQQQQQQQAQTPPPLYPEAEIYEGDDCEERMYMKYELCEVLGVGSTSTVHRCIHKITGQEYACKIIDIQNMDVQYHSMMVQFHTEITSLKSIHHPGIIQLYDVYILSTIKIYIIMELMLGGELFDYVVEKGTLSEEEASQIVRTVLSAIHYLHTHNIIHRDLKPENLLLKYKTNTTTTNTNMKGHNHNNKPVPIDVKIIDFGLSKLLTTDDTVASTFLGTRGYLAPEMLQRREYTSAVDTWAMGVIVFVLLCGCLPFDDDATMIMPNDDHVLQKRFILRFPRWAKNLSASAKDLLNHLLDINPITRYTAEQALYHPWVRGETAPSKNLLASPGRIRKSPAITNNHKRNGSNTSSGHRATNTKNHLGRKYAPDPCSLTPPTPRVRKGSF